jgi:hypothetical protein
VDWWPGHNYDLADNVEHWWPAEAMRHIHGNKPMHLDYFHSHYRNVEYGLNPLLRKLFTLPSDGAEFRV